MVTETTSLADIHRILNLDFDSHCDSRAVRATLIQLASAFRDLQAQLLFSDLTDQIEKEGLAEVEFLQALDHLRLAAGCFKKSGLHIN
jgi:hypothetical protein